MRYDLLPASCCCRGGVSAWLTVNENTQRDRTSDDPQQPDDDTELARLLDLLALLPPADPDDEWWQDFAAVQAPGDVDPADYVTSKVRGYIRNVTTREGQNRNQDVHDLAQYCLMFFDTTDPRVLTVLDRIVDYPPAQASTNGRRWAQDVATTAWRLYVPREAARRRQLHKLQH